MDDTAPQMDQARIKRVASFIARIGSDNEAESLTALKKTKTDLAIFKQGFTDLGLLYEAAAGDPNLVVLMREKLGEAVEATQAKDGQISQLTGIVTTKDEEIASLKKQLKKAGANTTPRAPSTRMTKEKLQVQLAETEVARDRFYDRVQDLTKETSGLEREIAKLKKENKRLEKRDTFIAVAFRRPIANIIGAGITLFALSYPVDWWIAPKVNEIFSECAIPSPDGQPITVQPGQIIKRLHGNVCALAPQ